MERRKYEKKEEEEEETTKQCMFLQTEQIAAKNRQRLFSWS